MRNLKILAGALILAASAPAAAQYQTRYYGTGDIGARIEQVDTRFQRSIQSGRISDVEAGEIRRNLYNLRVLQRQYARNGYSQWEQTELQRRLEVIREQIRRAAQTGDYRDRYPYDNYGYDPDGDRWDDRNDRWDDRNDRWDDRRDRWDDRRDRWDDRADRWDDRWRGRDCPPGLEWRNNGCVPPGQDWRYRDNNSGWYAVPERYRYQYRDTDRHYYRYRDGYIYQLDRRTGRQLNSWWVGRQ